MLLFLEDLGTGEVILIIMIVIILFGPKKIPEIARGLTKGMRIMKDATEDIKREILKETEDINPVKTIHEEINKAKETVTESTKEIEDNLDSVKR